MQFLAAKFIFVRHEFYLIRAFVKTIRIQSYATIQFTFPIKQIKSAAIVGSM